MEKLYSTGEFAKLAGVTIRTIRYYDKIGAKIILNAYLYKTPFMFVIVIFRSVSAEKYCKQI